MWGCKATLTWLIACAGLLALAGCGGKSAESSKPQSEHTPTPAAAQAPDPVPSGTAVPFPADKSATGLTESIIQGKNADLRSTGATEQGTALVLDATGGTIQYAVYRFNAGGNPPDSVAVVLDNVSAPGVFIGLANFTTQRWDFSGPYNAAKTLLALDSGKVSAADNIWVGIVAPAGQSATIDVLSIRVYRPDELPPTAELTSGVAAGGPPLTVNFDASGSHDPDGSIIEYAWDFDGDGVFDRLTVQPQQSFVYTQPGAYTARVRALDNDLQFSAPASVPLQVWPLPDAVLTTTTPVVDVGATVDLDATASAVAKGTIVNYEWDFDGNGIFGEPGQEAAATGQAAAAISAPGAAGHYQPAVRVTSDKGTTGSASVQLKVRGWQTQALPFNAEPIQLEVIDGAPALLYAYDQFYYARCSTADGFGSWTSVGLGTATRENGWISDASMAVIAGVPAVAYSDYNNGGEEGDIRYASTSQPDGGGGWTVRGVLYGGSATAYFKSSLAEVDGRPAFSCVDGTAHVLLFVRCPSVDGHGTWQRTSLPGDWIASCATSLAVVNGHPAITAVTFDGSQTYLNYSYSLDPDGAIGWSTLMLDSAQQCAYNASLSVVNGLPAIAYSSWPPANLSFADSTDPDGARGWRLNVFASGSNDQQGIHCLRSEGNPITLYDSETDGLHLATGTAPYAPGDWSSQPVAPVGAYYAAFCLVQDEPAVVYQDSHTSVMYYLRWLE